MEDYTVAKEQETLTPEKLEQAISVLPDLPPFVEKIRDATEVEIKASLYIPTDQLFAMYDYGFGWDPEPSGKVLLLTHESNRAVAEETVRIIRAPVILAPKEGTE